MTREEQVTQLAEWYGVDPRHFRPLSQEALDTAWIIGLARLNTT